MIQNFRELFMHHGCAAIQMGNSDPAAVRAGGQQAGNQP